jgi:hypothetical protein
MIKRAKWLLAVLAAGGLTLAGGCLGAFWQGLWNTGWPSNNPWLNLAVDAVKEATVYAP